MANLAPALRKELNGLRADYANQLPERILALQDTAEAAMVLLRTGAPGSRRQAVEGLSHITHRLAGSSSTFGFTAVANVARRLEALVESIAEDRNPAADRRLEIIKLLEQIKRASKHVGAEPPAGRRRATVLLVDDDEDTLALEALQLRGLRVEIEAARSGNEALGKILARPPDLIIADVKMEGMSGYELCRLVREVGEVDVPFLFLSALGAAPERVMGLRMGADDYIVKPIKGEELLLKVRRQLARNRRLRALQKARR